MDGARGWCGKVVDETDFPAWRSEEKITEESLFRREMIQDMVVLVNIINRSVLGSFQVFAKDIPLTQFQQREVKTRMIALKRNEKENLMGGS